ncbi:MAG: hypothetical protein EYC69_06500 [Bacteroidetes bacterium]|nr:MAG: hypothetical protein EYC69_06500 [Bacteroidota bacterium]
MKKALIIIVVFISFRSVCVANSHKTISYEEFQAEFGLLSKRMETQKKFSVSVSYSSYEKGSTEVVHDHAQGFVNRDYYKVHSSMMGVQTIQDGGKRLVVDSLNRIIAMASPDSMVYMTFFKELSGKVLAKAIKIDRLEDGGNIQYRLKFDENMPVLNYVILIDQSKLIRKIEIEFNRKIENAQGAKASLNVRINFDNWNFRPVFKNSEFQFERFVSERNNKFYLQREYSGYEFLDQRLHISSK